MDDGWARRVVILLIVLGTAALEASTGILRNVYSEFVHVRPPAIGKVGGGAGPTSPTGVGGPPKTPPVVAGHVLRPEPFVPPVPPTLAQRLDTAAQAYWDDIPKTRRACARETLKSAFTGDEEDEAEPSLGTSMTRTYWREVGADPGLARDAEMLKKEVEEAYYRACLRSFPF